MKTPARRPPGFAEPRAAATAEHADTPPADAAAGGARTRGTAELGIARRGDAEASATARDPYAGAATRQANMRLLEPLHTRYMHLVRELGDDGYRTSLTEVMHALLDAGPETPDQVRELVRAWRRRREP